MSSKVTWVWGRMLAVGLLGVLVALVPGCAVNRHVVRMQTQLKLMNDSLAIRQGKMDTDFESMTQLMRQSKTALEAARERATAIQQTTATSDRRQEIPSLASQLGRLRKSAEELSGMMIEMEARVEAMKEVQSEMFRSAVTSQPAARYEKSTRNTATSPDP